MVIQILFTFCYPSSLLILIRNILLFGMYTCVALDHQSDEGDHINRQQYYPRWQSVPAAKC